jgi:phosphomannomutase
MKFLNEKGEFISAEIGQTILNYIKESNLDFATVDDLGSYSKSKYFDEHIDAILKHEFVFKDKIKTSNFHVVVDCINSTGALSIPPLLDKLGVKYTLINEEVTGDFAHNPEPKIEHLQELASAVVKNKADMGIAVDPDVDRLAFMSSDGSMFGEEYTLVALADYILSHKKGAVVNNLSSTQALKDIAKKHGVECGSAAVGEVNVVNMMKDMNAVIGGEGNGGIIDPALHYGRDALIGIALMLSYLAESGKSLVEIKAELPAYEMIKDKINLEKGTDVDNILKQVALLFKDEEVNTVDGVKIIYPGEWVHLRKSNTEPIIRVYAESKNKETAEKLAAKIKSNIQELM